MNYIQYTQSTYNGHFLIYVGEVLALCCFVLALCCFALLLGRRRQEGPPYFREALTIEDLDIDEERSEYQRLRDTQCAGYPELLERIGQAYLHTCPHTSERAHAELEELIVDAIVMHVTNNGVLERFDPESLRGISISDVVDIRALSESLQNH